MSNGWTPERKATQRKAIYRWRPWEKSTGPKTPRGKANAARNSFKHGATTAEAKGERRRFRELIAEFPAATEV